MLGNSHAKFALALALHAALVCVLLVPRLLIVAARCSGCYGNRAIAITTTAAVRQRITTYRSRRFLGKPVAIVSANCASICSVRPPVRLISTNLLLRPMLLVSGVFRQAPRLLLTDKLLATPTLSLVVLLLLLAKLSPWLKCTSLFHFHSSALLFSNLLSKPINSYSSGTAYAYHSAFIFRICFTKKFGKYWKSPIS